MTLARMFDAAFPPAEPFPGCEAVAGYVGGNTPHVWTLEEWQRFANLRQLPIWVRDTRTGALSAASQGMKAAEAAIGLGWKPHAHNRRAIVLDLETAIVPEWVKAFADVLHLNGFSCWPYGSADFIFNDPTEDGYWVASYPGPGPVIGYPGEDVEAHQYAAGVAWEGGQVDLSVIDAEALSHLGVGPRRTPASS
jgi:hypothetical protein